jgi:MFS family permease
MIRTLHNISSLLLGMGIFLAGNALLGLLLGLKGADDGLSGFTMGIIMSGFFVGYVLGSWVCPGVIKRVGHIRAFTAFAAGSAIAALAYGLVTNPLAWWVLRLFSGLLLLGVHMTIESWLTERSREHRGQVFSVYVAVSLFAMGCGQYLLLVYGINGLGSFAVVAGLFCLGLIPVALTPVVQPEPIQTDRLGLRRLYAVTPVGAGGALVSGLVLGSFWSLSAVYGRGIGLDDIQVATFVVAVIAGGALLQWPIGWLSDHYDRRIVMIMVSLIGALSVVMMVRGASTDTTLLMAASFAFGGFAFSVYGLAVAQTHDRFLSHEALEATRALLLLHGIGAAVGPVLTGGLMSLFEHGFSYGLLASLLGLAMFTGFRVLIDPPVPEQDRTPYSAMDQSSPIATDLDPRVPDADEEIADADLLTPDVADLPAAPEAEYPQDGGAVDNPLGLANGEPAGS